MKFDDVLRQADVNSQKDIVGLSFYFLDRVRGVDPVSAQEVRELISKSRSSVPRANVSSYIGRLEGNHLTHVGNNEYRLTPSGLDKYSSIAQLESYEDRLRDEEFITYTASDRDFYESLISNINRSYQEGIDDAVLIFSRKLLENLVLDILRTRYGLEDDRKELFYDLENGWLLSFSKLLENLSDNFYEDFNYWSDRFDEDIIQEIRDLKGHGDATAHSIEVNVSDEMIQNFRKRINPVVEVLFYVLEQIEKSEQPN